ncbi:MAG: transporter substrate-binding domain-containing protein [Clostridia bacterium]|nr:transporter substrate-binding domain-containing protein [Clostridia bacterium]
MKRHIMFFAFLCLLNFPFHVYASGFGGDVYKSATEYDYPPFSVTRTGEADGFSVELLKAVADVAGINISFKIDAWDTIKEELEVGDLDILPLVGYTQERDQYYDFTVPYMIMQGNIFIRKDETEISSEEDLFGKEIIVMQGDNAHEYAVRMNFADEFILTETYEEAFKLLSSGKHDAILAQSLVGEQLIIQLDIKNVKAATQVNEDGLTQIRTNLSGFEQKFCFAVKEGDKELLAKLNEGLAIVSANGEFDRLYKKWFPFIIDSKPDPIEVLKAALILLTPVLLLVILVGVIYTRRKIRQKTEELEESNKARMEMVAKLRSQQKFEAIGVLASGVAHEINNPINGVLNYGQLIFEMTSDIDSDLNKHREDISTYSGEIINESNRITSIVSTLLQLSKKGGAQFVPCNIASLINRLLSLVRTNLKRDQISLDVVIDEDLPDIDCREQELQQVILNLIFNAKDALNEKYEGYHKDKKIQIKAHQTTLLNDEKGVRITVEDYGNGIPEEVQDNIFDPFFTTKGRAEAAGLGMYISYGIIKDHHGILSFETQDGEYTKFHIDLLVKQHKK